MVALGTDFHEHIMPDELQLGFSVSKAGKDTLDLDIYSHVGGWDDDESSAKNARRKLRESNAKQIRVRINSPGGFTTDGLAIYQQLVEHPAKVEVTIDGWCCSAATLPAMAGDVIRMGQYAEFMIHDPRNVQVGDARAMRKMADRLDKEAGQVAELYAQRTGLSADEVREMMRSETWFTAAEARKAGFVDEIVKGKERSPRSLNCAAEALQLFNNVPSRLTQEPDPDTDPDKPLLPGFEGSESKKWSTAYINNLPDSAFAFIKPGGTKDDEGKTTPRSLRMLPHHDDSVKSGTENKSVDLPHLRAALSRLPQADMTSAQRTAAKAHLRAHADALLGKKKSQQAASGQENEMPFDEIAIALGLSADATEAQVLAKYHSEKNASAKAIADANTSVTTVTAERDSARAQVSDLLAAAGVDTVDAAKGAIESGKSAKGELAKAQAEIDAQRKAAEESERDSILNGLSTPDADGHIRLTKAQHDDFKTKSLEFVKEYAKTAPVIVAARSEHREADPAVRATSGKTYEELTGEQRAKLQKEDKTTFEAVRADWYARNCPTAE